MPDRLRGGSKKRPVEPERRERPSAAEVERLRAARRFVEIRDRLRCWSTAGDDLSEFCVEAEREIEKAQEETVEGDRLFARRWAPKALARYEVALALCSDFLPAQIGAQAARTYGPRSRRPLIIGLAVLGLTIGAGVAAFVSHTPVDEALAAQAGARSAGYLDFVGSVASQPPGTLLRTFVGHTQAVVSLAVSHSGFTLASGGGQGEIMLWDLATGATLRSFTGHHGPVTALAFNTESDQLLSGGADGAVHLWENATGARLQTLTGHTGKILAIAWSREAHRVITVGTDALKIWNLKKGTEVRSIAFQPGDVAIATIGPRGRKVMTAGAFAESPVCVYDLESTAEERPLHGEPAAINEMAIAPDGRFAISGDATHAMRMWDLEAGRELYAMRGHSQPVETVAFSPEARFLLSGSDDATVRLWDRVRMQEMLKLTGPQGHVLCVGFTRGGRYAVSGGEDHTLRLWKLWEGTKSAP